MLSYTLVLFFCFRKVEIDTKNLVSMKNHESMKFENQNVILKCYQISNKFLFSKQTNYPSFLLNKISPNIAIITTTKNKYKNQKQNKQKNKLKFYFRGQIMLTKKSDAYVKILFIFLNNRIVKRNFPFQIC